ncbi:hypothetical protein BDY24DRAFT_411364 [Mrakia frigida]|uniref:J domain-containing protein n=1 Tax=Mrakia frigida TaxID=29902 RepID=UPI003FCBFC1C
MASLLTPLLPLLLPTVIPFLPIPPRYRNDRVTLITLLSLYILFTFVTSDLQISASRNFYSSLGLSRSVEDGAAIKDGWKAFARRNHPDRVGVGRGGEEVFVEARRAYDVLSDEVRRWAYDRFGPDIAFWKGVATQREYLLRGVTSSIGYYVVSAAVHLLMRITGQVSSSSTSFFRNLLLPTLLILELSLLFTPTPYPSSSSSSDSTFLSFTHPFPIRLLTRLFPQRTQYQLIQLLHNLYVAAAMFLNQLGPLLFPQKRKEVRGEEKEKELEQMVERLGVMVRVAEMEAAKIYTSELQPVLSIPSTSSPTPLQLLEAEMEQILIDSRIRSHPAVAPVWAKAVAYGRAKEAAGSGVAGGGGAGEGQS